MALIELAGRRVGGDIGIGAGHLALFLEDDAGARFVLSAYTDNNLIEGDLYVETHAGSAWVPEALSSESTLDPNLFVTRELNFDGRDPADIALLIDQYAQAINAEEFSYSALFRNSNSVIGSLLDLVGINVSEVLPNPPDVGKLGFVARDNRLEFDYQIIGTDGADLMNGDSGAQVLVGAGGADTLIGASGDDLLEGGSADDLLQGGEGTDTARFAGAQSSHTLILEASGASITDRKGGGNGTDQLDGIELLTFDDPIALFSEGQMPLDLFDGALSLTSSQFSEVIELYVAYFNRAPDALGLYYWATEYAGGFTVAQMAANFFGQAEAQTAYAVMLDTQGNLDTADLPSVQAFVTAVYGNVLGRAPDTAGLDYWVGELQDNPLITPDLFVLAIIGGAKNPSNPTSQTAADQAYLATKTDLGAYFAVIKGMSDVADATAAMALFDGSETSRDATLAAMDGHHADALDPETGDFLMPLIGVIEDPFALA